MAKLTQWEKGLVEALESAAWDASVIAEDAYNLGKLEGAIMARLFPEDEPLGAWHFQVSNGFIRAFEGLVLGDRDKYLRGLGEVLRGIERIPDWLGESAQS